VPFGVIRTRPLPYTQVTTQRSSVPLWTGDARGYLFCLLTTAVGNVRKLIFWLQHIWLTMREQRN